MTKTKRDIATAALRHLAVLSADEPAQAADYAYAVDMLDSIAAEMAGAQGLTMPSDLDATPDALLLPLSRLLAVEVASYYAIQAEPRSRAVGRLRAALISNDLPDSRDTDEDGTITDAEVAAGMRALYY
jgi:hypothetical protein